MQPIFLIPLNLHNLDFFDRLGSVLGDIFETEVHTRPGREMPAHAYHRRRDQYNSPAVLEALIPVLESETGGGGGAGVSVLFFERTVKEAVHEIGHLKGLSHCPDSGCVMHFSNSLRDSETGAGFESRC